MIDLTTLSVEELKNLRTEIAGELARRSEDYINLKYEDKPKSGAMFYDRPAIGGDRNEDLWFPTLESANAFLARMAGPHSVRFRKDGTTYCDYTSPGCHQSDMWTEINKA